jgi:ribonuclease R
VRFADGVIHSAARLTYTGVAHALAATPRGRRALPADLQRMLVAAGRLSELLSRRRHERGSIDFDLPESQLLFDTEGAMTGIELQPRNAAQLLIEEFMLAANDAVAETLERQRAPCLFRVHEPPDPAKLEALAAFVESFGLSLSAGARAIRPQEIQRLLRQAAELPQSRVISQMTLRAMKQARYDVKNVGHFGLASPAYCHFTSPIRRYPDLEVHRLLRALRRRAVSGAADHEAELPMLALHCSELERNAEAAERELLLWKKVAFIADRVGQRFDAVVTGVARFGLFVQLNESLVEGLLRAERLGEERFEFVESRQELRGLRTGRSFRLGDALRVQVLRVDRVLLRVDLALDPAQARARARAPLKRRPSRRRRTV